MPTPKTLSFEEFKGLNPNNDESAYQKYLQRIQRNVERQQETANFREEQRQRSAKAKAEKDKRRQIQQFRGLPEFSLNNIPDGARKKNARFRSSSGSVFQFQEIGGRLQPVRIGSLNEGVTAKNTLSPDPRDNRNSSSNSSSSSSSNRNVSRPPSGDFVSREQFDSIQEQLQLAKQTARKFQEVAEELKLSTIKRMKEQEQQLNQSFTDLRKLFGDKFDSVQTAIAEVERKTGREVDINERFVAQAKNLLETKGEEGIEEAIGKLAAGHAEFGQGDDLETRFANFQQTEEGQQFVAGFDTPEGAVADDEAALEGEMIDGQENFAHASDTIADFNPDRASGTTGGLLLDPNATSEEILISLFQQQSALLDKNTERILQFLESSSQNTKVATKGYQERLATTEREAEGVIKSQRAFLDEKYEVMEEELRQEHAEDMRGLNEKRSRLEGYMKAKLHAEGILESDAGLQKYVTSITKYDTMIRDTKTRNRLELRNLDLARTESMIDLSARLVEIHRTYDDKYIALEQNANNRLEENAFAALRDANENELAKGKLVSDLYQDLLKLRAEERKERNDAIESARKELLDRAERLTDELGFLYVVKDGEIQLMRDEEGQPVMSWDRQKSILDLELKGDRFDFDMEKEAYDQWEASQSLAIRKLLADNTITKTEHDIRMDELDQAREFQEFRWERDEIEREHGFQADGAFSTSIINGRKITLDAGALASLKKIDQEMTPFGGLRTGSVATASTRDQAATIKSMADRLQAQGKIDFSFNPNNPNETAAKLRAAGHQVADVGHSQHEKGRALDLFPDMQYINSVKPIMEKYGWRQTVPGNDPGHFEFVGGKLPDNVKAWEKIAIGDFVVDQLSTARNKASLAATEELRLELEEEWGAAKSTNPDITLAQFLQQMTEEFEAFTGKKKPKGSESESFEDVANSFFETSQ